MYVSVQRRVANGVQIIGSYTLGKILSDPIYVPLFAASGGINTGPSNSFQNTRDRRPEHTIDSLDVTHRLTVSVQSRLPFGKGHRFLNRSSWASTALRNFNINGILTLQGGTPLAITGASNYVATRPNFSGINPHSNCTAARGGQIQYHTRNCWFNPAAFTNPLNYQFGNTPRVISSLRGPGAVNFDVSIVRNFKITRKYTGMFRLETFNIFNHPNFSNPNTSFNAALNQGDGSNTNGNFGKITSAAAPRVLQAGVKISF